LFRFESKQEIQDAKRNQSEAKQNAINLLYRNLIIDHV